MSAGQPWATGSHSLQQYAVQHLVVGLRQVWPLAANGDPGALRNSVIHVALHLREGWNTEIRWCLWGVSLVDTYHATKTRQCIALPACFACDSRRTETPTEAEVSRAHRCEAVYGMSGRAHPLHAPVVDERAQRGARVHATAQLEPTDALCHRLHECVIHAILSHRHAVEPHETVKDASWPPFRRMNALNVFPRTPNCWLRPTGRSLMQCPWRLAYQAFWYREHLFEIPAVVSEQSPA